MLAQLLTSRTAQIVFLILLLTGATGLQLLDPPFVEQLHQKSFDAYNRLLPRRAGDEIVIIGADEESVKRLGQWPWGRNVMADLTAELHRLGAKSIGFDIFFQQRDRTAAKDENPGGAQDAAANDLYFADKIRRAGNVTLGFAISEPGPLGRERVEDTPIVYNGGPGSAFAPYLFASEYFSKSLSVLRAAAAGGGHTNFLPETDGALRRLPLMIRHIDAGGNTTGVYPALSLETLRVALGVRTPYEITGSPRHGVEKITLGPYVIPTDAHGAARLYYAGHKAFPVIPVWKVLAGDADPALVRDKIVLVGISSANIGDVRSSPLDAYMQGVEMHAEMIGQILRGQFLRRSGGMALAEAAATALTALLVIFLAQEMNALALAALLALLLTGEAGLSLLAFARFGWLVDPACTAIIAAVIFTLAAILANLRTKIISNEKSRFLALMSHEIRTPMTGILGMIEFMKDEGLSRAQHLEFINTISDCSKTLLNTLNDVLDMSKLEEGKLEISNVNFDLYTVLNNCKGLLTRMAQNKGITLSVEIEDGVPRDMHGDPHRLQQIVLNLMNNAIKFTAKGGVTAHCAFKGGEKPMIRVEVRDTGIGISEKNMKKLFKGFSQADSSIARKFGGTGLGLSIAKDLLLLMGGSVGVTSKLGEGSVFWFELPYIPPAAQDAAEEEAADAPPMNVLLAEDNKVNQQVALRLLTNKGHRVSVADDGGTVVTMAQEQDFDMILMDMNMPVKSGIDATREIRALGGKYKTLPIIALTANVVDEYVKKCIAAGMNAHVAKPFSTKELYGVMARFAPEKSANPPPAADKPPAPATMDTSGNISGPPDEMLNENLREIRRQLGPAYLNELIGNSLRESARLLKAGQDAPDHAALGNAMHDLKNVSGLIGLVETSRLAAVVEALCRKSEPTAVPDMMKILARAAELEMSKMEKVVNPGRR